MKKSTTRYARLEIETLEEILLPSGSLPWPVSPPPMQPVQLLNTYGQFVNIRAGTFDTMLLHAGVDILVPSGTVVRPIQSGAGTTVFNIRPGAGPYTALAASSATNGFNYWHIIPGRGGPTNPPWAAGDQIAINSVLGRVAAGAGNFLHHLHVDYTDVVGDAREGRILRPVADPLEYLTSLNDNQAPTLFSPANPNTINFRAAASDVPDLVPIGGMDNVGMAWESPTSVINTDHRYFSDLVGARFVIGAQARTRIGRDSAAPRPGTADIDIIASMSDRTVAAGLKLNVKHNKFQITGQTFGADTGLVSSFWFAGEFLDAGQSMNQFYNTDLTRVIYEHDWKSRSSGRSDTAAAAANRAFWYIMTNTDGDDVVELADRQRFWNSNVAVGYNWNAPNTFDATSNATSEFADDFYQVFVQAEDEAGNLNSDWANVVLVNWLRTIQTSSPNIDLSTGLTISGGSQYRANQSVNFYLVPDTTSSIVPLTEPYNGPIPAGLVGITVTADANGNLPNYVWNCGLSGPGRYFLVADYNGDGVYTRKLDAATVVTIRRDTVTAVTANPSPSTVGQNVTLRATVTGVGPGAGVPYAGVNFYNGPMLLGRRTLVNGVATLAVNNLPAGNLALRAEYEGSVQFGLSSGTVNHTVNPPNPARRPAQSSLTPVPGSSVFGQAVTLTATVGADDGNPGTPTGTVSFYDGGDYLGDATLVNGTASLSLSNLNVGSHNLVVDYNGDDDFNFVAASSTLVTSQAQPTVSVMVYSGVYSGIPASAVATVTGVLAGVDDSPAESLEGITPTLTYYYGSLPVGTPLLEAPYEAGTYTVVATYAGSDNYLSADSEPQTFVISKATPILALTTGDGTANGTPFDATVEVAGVVVEFDDILYWELEGVTPTLTYFDAVGTPLSGAPADPGTYTVVANFAGSTNYESAGIGPITFTINPVVNEFVSTVPSSQSTNEDSPLVFSSSNSNAISVGVPPGEGVGDIIVQVTITATNGTLTLNGTSGLGFSFSDSEGTGAGTGTADIAMTLRGSVNDINAALDGLAFAPTAGYHGEGGIQFVTNDLFMSGWIEAMIDTKDVAITVTPVNDAPTGANNTVTAAQDTDYTFSAAAFGFADLLDLPANYFLNLIITSLPTVGTLLMNGTTPVWVGQVIPAYAIAYLTYTPPAGQTGSALDSFKFKVQDAGGTDNGGIDTSLAEFTLTLDVV